MGQPTCTVNTLATAGGVNIAAATLATIDLTDKSATSWTIACIGTDELATAPVLTINQSTKTATFTTGAAGSAYLFSSTTEAGTATFTIYVLAASGSRVLAFGEKLEGNATAGWLSTINPMLRSGSKRVRSALDANHTNAWKLAEAASPVASDGSLTIPTLAAGGTNVANLLYQEAGIVSHCIDTGAGPAFFTGASGSANRPATTTALTFEAWVYLEAVGSIQAIAMRQASASWLSPYTSIYLWVDAAGALRYGVTISGVSQQGGAATNGRGAVPTKQWCHVGWTFDGTSVRRYLNGTKVDTTALAGSIDWQSDGNWTIGCNPDNSSPLNGRINDVRVSNIVRPDTYFRDLWRQY